MPKRKLKEISKDVPTLQSKIKLNSGYEMPVLGFGVWSIAPDQTEKACKHALETGYRLIDTAPAYRNEAGCGAAINAAIKSGLLAREDVFLTTKVAVPLKGYDETKKSIDASLAKLNLDYIDLILLHGPYGGSEKRKGAWKALVEAVDAGKAHSIGVSNYGIHHLEQLETHIGELQAERGGKPSAGGIISVGQWEAHPWCVRADIEEWCKKRDVVFEAYSPLARGFRMKDKTLKVVAESCGKTPAQVLIRWSLQRGFVPLPKSNKKARIRANAEVFDFEIGEEDMRRLETKEFKTTYWDPTVSGLEELVP